MTTKIAAVRISSTSDLDGDDLSDDQKTDQLEAQSGCQKLAAHRIVYEKPGVGPVNHEHHSADTGRHGGDDASRHDSLRADALNPLAQLESLADDVGDSSCASGLRASARR